MAKLDAQTIANEISAKTFDDFVDKFQNNIETLTVRQKFNAIQQDKEYELDEDGYIIGDVWSEKIAGEIMDLNGFTATVKRMDTLKEAREVFGKASVPTDYKVVAGLMNTTSAEFLKMFPKYPIIYFTRWGGLRKPFNLPELRANPVKSR